MKRQEFPVRIKTGGTTDYPITLRLLTEGRESKTSHIELELQDDIEMDEAEQLKEILKQKVNLLKIHHV